MATVVRIGARVVALWALLALVALVGPGAALAAGVALPDGRRYELVSPPAKNGVEVIPQTNKTHVRPDGNAVTFSALGGFGSVEGSAFDFEYLAERDGRPGTSGWSTHGINPLGRGATFDAANANGSTYLNSFTPDLSGGIYKTWRPLVDAPNVGDVSNLYRVRGLDGGTRSVELLSDSVNSIPVAWFAFQTGRFVTHIQPALAGASSNLDQVVFESSLRLTEDAPPYQGLFCLLAGVCPTKLYENDRGTVQLVGRVPQAPDTTCDEVSGPACVPAPSSEAALSATTPFYSQLAVSVDGRRIYFQVPAGADSGALYLREDGTHTEQVAADGQFWTASANGARAFFTTTDSLLPADTDSSPDLYMYDREAPAGSRLTLLSASSTGIDGYVEAVVGASSDGDYVYFVCDGQLVADEPPADAMGLYVWHDGRISFIGAFQSFGEANANGPRTDWTFVGTTSRSRITPDGHHLLFMTLSDAGFSGRGGFTSYNQAGHQEFYVYNAVTARLACASCNPSGAAATSDALIDVRENAATSATTSDSAQALTDDGRRVFFNSSEALVQQDTNGRTDAYEYDLQTGMVRLLSSGKSTAPSYFVDASPNGNDVFIITRERLVGWDVDDSYDLYDARVGGGFPDPPVITLACVGEGCRGASTPAPSADGFATLGVSGRGNIRGQLRPHRRCRRRAALRSRGKRRCIRPRLHRRSHRGASQDERSGR